MGAAKLDCYWVHKSFQRRIVRRVGAGRKHPVDLLIKSGTQPSSSACLSVDKVAEAAIIPVLDEMRRVPEVYIALKP